MTDYVTEAQKVFLQYSQLALEKGTVYVDLLREQVINPYFAQIHQPHVAPLIKTALVYLSPLLLHIESVRDRLPEFPDVPLNYLGIAVIVLHVAFYNLTAQLEYKTRIFTKIFGRLAIYLNALLLIASALIRDHYLVLAIQKDENSRILFDAGVAEGLSFALISFGIFLNLWVLFVLGFKNMYNGDCFGYYLDSPVTHGPYRFFDDPQYFGTTLCLLGYAVKNQSRIGYGLTGVMYLVFSFSVMFIEGPRMTKIYAEREKRNPVKTGNKKKKNV